MQVGKLDSCGEGLDPRFGPETPVLFTIGAYGCDADRFFAALLEAKIDTFCDVRARRAVRGPEYAFANAARLQWRLAELGLRYLHFPALAPPAELREQQAARDHAAGIARRRRIVLGQEFVEGYRHACLATFDSAAFMESLGSDARRVALFCVEREPAACHRSLLAERLRDDLHLEVVHLTP